MRVMTGMPLDPAGLTVQDARLTGIPPNCLPCEAIRAFRAFAVPLVQPKPVPFGVNARERSLRAEPQAGPLRRLLDEDKDEAYMQDWHRRGHPGGFMPDRPDVGLRYNEALFEPMRRVHYRDRAWGNNAWPSLPLVTCPHCGRLELQPQRKPGDWRAPLCSHGWGDPSTGYESTWTLLGPWHLRALLHRLCPQAVEGPESVI